MVRFLYLVLASLALLVASVAMRADIAVAAVTEESTAAAAGNHCGKNVPQEHKQSSTNGDCFAMCTAMAPCDASLSEAAVQPTSMPSGYDPAGYPPFEPRLPTPPPRRS